MRFEFATTARIVFGVGQAGQIPEISAKLGSKVCLVTGGDPSRHGLLVDGLFGLGLAPEIVPVANEPDTETIIRSAARARQQGCDVVVALGGGSVLDAGKALASLITNTADLMEYLEVIGQGKALDKRPVPLIAVPTTAGTGSEATANAVLASKEHKVKVSLRSPWMLPAVAVVDPELSASMPPWLTAATGMDALTQLIETFVSHQATPRTRALCRDGIPRAARSLRQAWREGSDMDARSGMALAALYSGIALANAKLGAVHGLAAPLGGEFHAPHGQVCAALLPHVMEANIAALQQQDPGGAALHAYKETAAMLTGEPGAVPENGTAFIKDLCVAMEIPPLSWAGVTQEALPDMARKGGRASSMRGNPVLLDEATLIDVMQRAL